MTGAPSANLVVSEVFGPTWQGEGPSVGQRAAFVRLGRCNLECGWCDTPYTWDWKRFDPERELQTRSTDDILNAISAMDVDLLVITGGEPLLQQHRLEPMIRGASQRGWRVEVETNGTIAPQPDLVRLVHGWNVSPKLANAGMPEHRRLNFDVLRAFQSTGRARFKFVVVHPSDLDEIAAVVAEGDLSRIWVMPEGNDAEAVIRRLRELAPAVLAHGWNVTPRLHVLVWDGRRGV